MQTAPHCKWHTPIKRFFKISCKKKNLKSPSVLFIVNSHPNKIILDTIHSCAAATPHYSCWGIFMNSVVLKYGCLPSPSVNLSSFLVSCVSGDSDFQILQLDLISVCWEDRLIPSLCHYSPFPEWNARVHVTMKTPLSATTCSGKRDCHACM